MTLLVLAPLISLMPEATLGSLVLVAAASLINLGEFRDMARIRRKELIWALLAVAGVILLGILEGILVAVLISLLTLLIDVDRPPVYAIGRKPGTDVFRPLDDHHPDLETIPGLLIARTEGRLFFANIAEVIDRLWELIHQSSPQALILDCDAIPDIEYTALKSLEQFETLLHNAGISLELASLNPTALNIIRQSPLGKKLGSERMFLNLEEAVEAHTHASGHGAQ